MIDFFVGLIVSRLCHLDLVGSEAFVKLRWIKVGETVGCLLYRVRLTEAAWKTLSVVRFILPGIGHVGCDVHLTDDRWIGPRFGNYGSPIAVSDKSARPI
jgi:hypothetical protein